MSELGANSLLLVNEPCEEVDADAHAVPPGRANTSVRRPVGAAGTAAACARGQKERGRGQASH